MNMMMSDVSVFQPLKTNFSISSECLGKDITFLLEISGPDYDEGATLKLVNTLRRNGFSTIEDVVSVSAKRIQLLKWIGDKSFTQLLVLLKKAERN
ncbi:hypothetical protein [Paenibacillus stellifer]|nr:hypothetical protein [Paenibacillus stellifer]